MIHKIAICKQITIVVQVRRSVRLPRWTADARRIDNAGQRKYEQEMQVRLTQIQRSKWLDRRTWWCKHRYRRQRWDQQHSTMANEGKRCGRVATSINRQLILWHLPIEIHCAWKHQNRIGRARHGSRRRYTRRSIHQPVMSMDDKLIGIHVTSRTYADEEMERCFRALTNSIRLAQPRSETT